MEPVLLFLHIPKTGGTSLAQCIFDQYRLNGIPSSANPDSFFCDGVDHYPHGFYACQDPPCTTSVAECLARADLQAVAGHFSFGIHAHLDSARSFRYVTFLRDPVDRIVSLYRHIRHFDTPNKELHQKVMGDGTTLLEFASTWDLPELENDQTRRIAGQTGQCSVQMFDEARAHFQSEFAFVGLTEQFDESLILLRRKFDWNVPLHYFPENVSSEWDTPSQGSKIEITSETVSAIRERNRFDCELYETAKTLFEQSRSAESSSGLKAEVEEFRKRMGTTLLRKS